MTDRYGRMILRLCVLAATVSTLAIPAVVDTVSLLWAALFFAGGTVAGIYVLGIALIGQDFRGHTLAVVSTGFTMAYAAGSIVGPTPVGYLIDLFGPEALPLALTIGFVGLSTYLFLGDGSQEQAGREPQPAVPNLKYLEDSQFEEDETAAVAGTAEAVSEEAPAADASPFRPARAAPSPLGPAPPRPEPASPVENFEEQIKWRRAEIAEIVARRQKSREAQQSRTQRQWSEGPPQTREPPTDPSAPLPPPDDDDG
jgi:hypothetical protein